MAKKNLPSVSDKVRRKPVPIPGRMSNAAIQELIDSTLDMRILGDASLREAMGTSGRTAAAEIKHQVDRLARPKRRAR
jgi:hypothetical protein